MFVVMGLLLVVFIMVLVQSISNVILYGMVDQYLGYMYSSSGKSLWVFNDGVILCSCIGFKGYEDLGGGYVVIFMLENGFVGDIGGLVDSICLFDCQFWVGIKILVVGEFCVGCQNSVFFFIGGVIDYIECIIYGFIINIFGVLLCFDNDFLWKLLCWVGFQFDIYYVMLEIVGEGLGCCGVYQFGLDYINGLYCVGYVGLVVKFNVGGLYSNMV